jgi:hypothetical protein
MRDLRLLFEAVDAAVAVNVNHAEAEGLVQIDLNGGESDVRSGVQVLLHHLAVIHLVNMIAGENENVLGLLRTD